MRRKTTRKYSHHVGQHLDSIAPFGRELRRQPILNALIFRSLQRYIVNLLPPRIPRLRQKAACVMIRP